MSIDDRAKGPSVNREGEATVDWALVNTSNKGTRGWYVNSPGHLGGATREVGLHPVLGCAADPCTYQGGQEDGVVHSVKGWEIWMMLSQRSNHVRCTASDMPNFCWTMPAGCLQLLSCPLAFVQCYCSSLGNCNRLPNRRPEGIRECPQALAWCSLYWRGWESWAKKNGSNIMRLKGTTDFLI